MYNNIKACVVKNGEKSNYFSILSGVRQGEILSPLLFNIFVNDLEHYMLSQGCKLVDFNDDIYNNYLKILLLLYADDTVIFSNSERGLQKCLDTLHAYCMKWKLNVNSDKTKVIIFRKRRSGCNYTFKYAQDEIKTVDSFKYLGILFNYNGMFKECKNDIKEKATRAAFALLSKGRRLKLPVDIMLDLFNKTVLPILLYGCEVWGTENCSGLDLVFTKFCKYLFGIKSNTPNCMIYGETGYYPVTVHVKIRIINYWIRTLSAHDSKMNKKLYAVMYRLNDNDLASLKWISFVRDTLYRNGFGHIWNEQSHITISKFKTEFKQRLLNQFQQEWRAMLNESSKCIFYREVKTEFVLESYLYRIPFKFARYILKLRTCNHKLEIEVGRYTNLERHERICKNCTLNVLGDEYHLFYECSNVNIAALRRKFIPQDIRNNRSMYNFLNIFRNLSDIKLCIQIGKFLEKCACV